MKRYWEIYAIMFRNSLIREMSFKANFLLWILVELLWFLGQIVFIEVIFSHIEKIGDWTKWQVVLLIGTHQLIAQLFQAFFFMNVMNLPEQVRTGKMDFALLLPVDAQFVVSVRQFGFDSVVNALVSVGVVLLSLGKLGLHPGAWNIALYLVALALGIGIHYAILFSIACASFWIVRAQGVLHGYFSFFQVGRYPDMIYRGFVRFLFTWVIPVILVANVPARLLMGFFSGQASGAGMALFQLAAAAAVALFLTRALWRFALRHYRSASS